MRMFVPTCDQMRHVIPTYAKLHNKYWGEHQTVTVLCYKEPEGDLPHNFEVVSLGDQKDFGRSWTDAMIPYFESIPDECFMLNLDDSFIIDYVDEGKLEILKAYIEMNFCEKAMLHSHLNKHSEPYLGKIVRLKSDAPYRTSIHPAIWTKKQFQSFLKPGYTLWDFELKNQPQSKQDGTTILSFDYGDDDPGAVKINPSNHIINMANIYRGTIAPDPTGGFHNARQEDKQLIMEMIDEHKNRTNK